MRAARLPTRTKTISRCIDLAIAAADTAANAAAADQQAAFPAGDATHDVRSNRCKTARRDSQQARKPSARRFRHPAAAVANRNRDTQTSLSDAAPRRAESAANRLLLLQQTREAATPARRAIVCRMAMQLRGVEVINPFAIGAVLTQTI